MRKIAEKWLALLMAMLMLLSSMPLTALAEDIAYSGGLTINASPREEGDAADAADPADLAAAAVDAAVNGNQESGDYLVLATLKPPAGPVSTGATFQYTFTVNFGPAPTYVDPVNNNNVSTYSQYENVKVTFKAPNHIAFADGSKEDTYTFDSPIDVSDGGTSRTQQISARMTNNGQAWNGFDYGALTAIVEADVTLADGTVKHFQYEMSATEYGNTTGEVTNTASTAWTVQKSAPTVTDNGEEAGTVTIQWEIKVGSPSDEGLKGANTWYNRIGTLNLDSFTLSDTLPTVEGVGPRSWKLIVGNNQVASGNGSAVSTDYINKTDLTGDAANADGVKTAGFTTYTLEAVYPRDIFVLDHGVTDEKEIDNTATITYKPVEEEVQTASSTAEDTYGIPTDGGSIVIKEYLQFGSSEKVGYNSFYAGIFPAPDEYEGIPFEIKRVKDDGSEEFVKTVYVTATGTTTVSDLAPGTYNVYQLNPPVGTNAATTNPVPVKVVSNEPATAEFVNPVPGIGIIHLEKVNENGSPLSGATFTLDDGNGHTYKNKTVNSDGGLTLPVYAADGGTTYTITEDITPAGYYKGYTGEVTVTPYNGEQSSVVKYTVTNIQQRNGSVTVTKKLNNETTAFADTAASFTFTLYQGQKEKENGDIQYKQFNLPETTSPSFTLSKDNSFSKTISNLPAADDEGNPYYYKIEEAAPTEGTSAYYTPQTQLFEFHFWDEYNDRPGALDVDKNFVNKLEYSDLKILKMVEALGSTDPQPQEGVSFVVYNGVPGTPGAEVETIETDGNGYATAAKLPIYAPDGKTKIQYYVQEKTPSGNYIVDYPGESDSYWGPIELSDADRVTDASNGGNTYVLNKENRTAITILKQDKNGNAIEGATFTVTFPDRPATTFTTDENGKATVAHSDGSALVPGEYTITETSVPSAYLASGSVAVTGIEGATSGTNDAGPLTATFTLEALESATATFTNDNKPTLTVKKTVDGVEYTADDFTFELYTKNADGVTYTQVKKDALGKDFDTFTNAAAPITLEPGTYYVKEVGFPVGVVAPADTYIPVTLEKNEDETLTIDNTSSLARLTIVKQDSKTDAYLAGATVQVSVAADGLTDAEKAYFTAQEFTPNADNSAYIKTVTTTNTSAGVAISNLPALRDDGETPFTYAVQETDAPDGYIADATVYTVQLVDAENKPANKTQTILNIPENTITVTKLWYSQWDALNGNKQLLPLKDAVLALYRVDGNGTEGTDDATISFVATATTDASGVAQFADLNGEETYIVFELSNPAGYVAPDNSEPLAGENLRDGMLLSDARAYYNSGLIDLNTLTTGTDKAITMENMEEYVQLSLEKWYQPERKLEAGETDDFPIDGWIDDPAQGKVKLDHAKFHLYGCTYEYYKTHSAPDSLADLQANYDLDSLSDYVYESGAAENAGQGMVVTGPLPGGYVYWLYEFEAPAGFMTPEELGFEKCLSGPFNLPGEGNTEGSMENHPLHGPGTIRYVQFQLDKVGVTTDDEGNEVTFPLAGATFEVWLADEDGNKVGEAPVVSSFTTGVDVPKGETYNSGAAISESVKMHELYDQYGSQGYVEQIDRVLITPEEGDPYWDCEYRAYFLLVETGWPANASPEDGTTTWLMRVTTNDDTYDIDASEADTIWAEYDDAIGKKGPIRNVMQTLVPVVINKVGYVAGKETDTEPLAGATFTLYTRENGQFVEEAEATTDASGRAVFSLEPGVTYYYAETTVPDGYERVNAPAAPSEDYKFTTPYDTSREFVVDADANAEGDQPVKNVAKRTLKLRKTDATGENYLAATFEIRNASGQTVAEVTTPADGSYAEVTNLPAGTYTVVETHLKGRELTDAERSNFLLLNENETFTFGDNESEKLLDLKNPGTGSLTITKVNDAETPEKMAGVQFTLEFAAFASETETEPTNAFGAPQENGNLPTDVNDAVSGLQVQTNADGQITISGLIPGWYKLTEVEGAANANHVLAEPQVFKVGDGSFGGSAEVTGTITNQRYGQLTIIKETESGAQWPEDGFKFTVTDGASFNTTVYLKKDDPSATISSKTIYVEPGKEYTVTETSTGDWYTSYAVSGSLTEDENTEGATWFAEDAAKAVTVTVANANADEPVKVTFTNAGYLSGISLNKVDDSTPRAPVGKVGFALYRQDKEDDPKAYYDPATRTWGSAVKTVLTTDGNGNASLTGIKLPYDVVTGTATAPKFYLEETVTPEEYYPAEDQPVTLTAGMTDQTYLMNPIVNQKGLQITVTKYAKLYGDAGETEYLSGATFALYELVNGEYREIEHQTTVANGQITFSNLRKLTAEGEGYFLKEIDFPDGYVEGYTQVRINNQEVAANEDGYFPVADHTTTADVSVSAYNKPLSQIFILKRDYLDGSKLVNGANFTVKGTSEEGKEKAYTVNVTGKAPENAPAELPGGYELNADGYYVKDGTLYTVAATLPKVVEPGTYTVAEDLDNLPDGYLATGTVTSDDLATTKEVTVASDGSVAVVTFANVPNPEDLDLTLTKSASPESLESLQVEGGQTLTYTLSGFDYLTMPAKKVEITDADIEFDFREPPAGEEGNEELEETVEWSLTSVTVNPVSYDRTNPLFNGGTNVLTMANVTFLVDGEEQKTESRNVSTNAATFTAPANAHGVKIEYTDALGTPLHAGFKPGDITIALKASQPQGENVKTVAQINNHAVYEVQYDFGVVGATATETVRAVAYADVPVASEPTLPKATLAKTATVTPNASSGGALAEDVVTVGDTLTYEITLTSLADGVKTNKELWGVTDPVLGDVLPAGVEYVTAKATTTSDTLTLGEPALNGDVVTLTSEGQLMKGDKITLTIECKVLNVALVVNEEGYLVNRAYAYSPYKLAKNAANPNGVSFADEQGDPVSIAIDADVREGELGLMAEAQNSVSNPAATGIQKYVTVGEDTIGSNGFLIVNPDGTFSYKVLVINGSDEPIKNLWVVDMLPYTGDVRNSEWGPVSASNFNIEGAEGVLYYSTESKTPDSVFDDDTWLAGDLPADFTTSFEGAKTILAVIDELEPHSTATLTYDCTAPSKADADAQEKYYFYMAVNDAYMYNGPHSTLRSAFTQVTLTPDPVSLGDIVWIDRNADGLQGDERAPVPTVELILDTYIDGELKESNSKSVTGTYDFTGLAPAIPRGGVNATADYNADGDVDYSSLIGYGTRYTYKLHLDSVPDGYFVTEQYDGGSVPTVDDGGETRDDDSNFHPTGLDTEEFYLKVAQKDLSYDLGLVRMRDLTITKMGDNGKYVPGVTFEIYGPFDNTFVVSEDNKVDTITTNENGIAKFESEGPDKYLNAYAHYVVVERLPEDSHYSTETFTVAAGEGTTLKETTVSFDDAVEKAPCFILAPYAGENANGKVQDSVTVTNKYVTTGSLSITGSKSVIGDTDLEGYTFKLTSTNDPAFANGKALTATSGADGTFTFQPTEEMLTYDYSDVKNMENGHYVYTLTEVAPEESNGIEYDKNVYTITVMLSDTQGNGKITIDPRVTSTEAPGSVTFTPSEGEFVLRDAITFENRVTGGLSVEKQVEGNACDQEKSFTFTLTLKDKEGGAPLTDKPFTCSGDIALEDIKDNGDGTYTFSLTDGQKVEISGLTQGTWYQIREDSYTEDGYVTTVAVDEGEPDANNAHVGTIANDATPAVCFTNTRDVGKLTVKKAVSGNGGEEDKDFTFTVTLENPNVEVAKTYAGVEFEPVNGDPHKTQGTFTLKHNESKVFENIPAGTVYTVKEDPYGADGYEVPTNDILGDLGTTGVVDANDEITYTVTNTRYTADLTVEKKVENNSASGLGPNEQDAFAITVKLTAPEGEKLRGSYTSSDAQNASGDFSEIAGRLGATWEKTFNLAANETIAFTGLPTGTKYEVTEASYNGYDQTIENGKGTLNSDADATANVTATVTNKLDVGDLTVSKTENGNAPTGQAFAFTVTLTNDKVELDRTYGDVEFTAVEDNKHNVQATFTLKGGQTKTLAGIPAGTAYTVAEDDYTAQGYVTAAPVVTGDTNANAIIDAKESVAVAYTNTRDVGNLTVEKKVEGSGNWLQSPNALTEFDIKVTLTPPTGMPLTGTVNGELAQTEQTLTIPANGSVKFTGLPKGTVFTVTETGYEANGYEVEITNGHGTIGANLEAEAGEIATVTNKLDVGDLTVSKTENGNAPTGQAFAFTVTLTNDKVELDRTYGGVEFKPVTEGNKHNVQGTFTLEGGQSKPLTGIPAGTAYAVAEEDYTRQGYVTAAPVVTGDTNANATIDAKESVTVTYTNTRDVGDLAITKLVSGAGANEPNAIKVFEITVKLTAPTGMDLVGSYTSTDEQNASGTLNAAAPAADQKAEQELTFNLAADGTIAFTGLPTGTEYEVTETSYRQNGFITDITNGEGTIGDARIGEEDAISVTVSNYRPAGGLTIHKKVTGTGSSAEDTFKIILRLDNASTTVDGSYTATRTGEQGESTVIVTDNVAEITLKGNQSITIEGIPTGTTYTVTERVTNNGVEQDAKLNTENENGYALIELTGATGTIESDEESLVAELTNHRDVGNLTVEKKVEGSGNWLQSPNALTEFDIKVTLTPPTGMPLTGTVNGELAQTEQTLTIPANGSVKFTGLPKGTVFTVTETGYEANGYEVEITNGHGTIGANQEAEAGAIATVTNKLNVGDLSITKKLGGNDFDENKDFTFTVTLTNATVELDKTYGNVEFKAVEGNKHNVQGTVTLKGGETETITGIPAGTAYAVEEDASYIAEGYVPSVEAGEVKATIPVGQTASVTFLNTRNTGNLTVTKEVIGSGADSPNADTSFQITVKLTPPTDVDLVGKVNGNDVKPEETFTLRDGQSIKFTGLPADTTYEVIEEPIDAAYGFETPAYENAKGEIAACDEAAVGVTATVTNTIKAGALTIAKNVEGSGKQDRTFHFELTLTNDAGVNVDSTYAVTGVDISKLSVSDGKASFTLADEQAITIHGIPLGTRYTVTEAEPGSELEGYLQAGYVTEVNGGSGATFTGSGLTESGATVTFTNTRDVGELTIEKTVKGAIGETDKAFAFELTLTPSGNGVPVDGTYNATRYTGETGQAETISVENGVADFTLTHDQRLVIHELPAGASYIVRETSYALEGYKTDSTGATGTIPATGNMPTASFTNTRNAGSLIVEKVLAGNAPIEGDSFEFTITLTRTDGVNVDGEYQALRNGDAAETVTFTDGEATVTLAGGDTLEILDILSETAYAVEEVLPEYSDYDQTGASGDTGSIPIDESAQATFTNARNVGSLTLRKSVEGNAGETGRYFTFTVFMRDRYGRNVNGSFPMRGGAGANVNFTDGYATIRLADGDQVIISGILAGTYYSVTEREANTEGYVTTSSGSAGIIAAGGNAQAAFTNTRNVEEEVTSRTVYKVWNDENDAEGLRPDELIVYLLADGESVAAATLNEANGWSTVFDDLPVYNADGTQITYQVVEAYTAEYYVRYQYEAAVINITNTHNPDEFIPRDPDDPELLTLIMDNMVPLGGNVNMNEGDCFN